MTRKLWTLLYFITVSFSTHTAKAQVSASFAEFIDHHPYFPAYVFGLKSLPDGSAFTREVYDTSGQLHIRLFSYETGEELAVALNMEQIDKLIDSSAHTLNDYAFSPDTGYLLLALNAEPIYRHSEQASYYIFHRRSQTITPLNQGHKLRYAAWSPTGEQVAYTSDNNLFVYDLAKQTTVQLTYDGKQNQIINGMCDWVYEEEFGFTHAFFWSPGGDKIAYYRFDERLVNEWNMILFEDSFPNTYNYKYPLAGQTNAGVSIHIYDLFTDQSTVVHTNYSGEPYFPRIQWANSNTLAILSLNRQQNHKDILLHDVATGRTRMVYTEKNDHYLDITDDWFFLEDNSIILTSAQDGYNHIYCIRPDSGQQTQLTFGPWEVTDICGVDQTAGILYYRSHEPSDKDIAVYSIQLDGTGKKRLSPAHGVSEAQFNTCFSHYIQTWSDINTPPVVGINRANGEPMVELENNAWLKELLQRSRLTPYEFFSFTTADSLSLNGWMLKPPRFKENKKHPVLLYVYGGPGHQTVQNEYPWSDYLLFRHLSNLGYVIVSIDPRGTYGRGEAFKKWSYKQLGVWETADLTEFSEYLKTLNFVDAQRLGIYGWSFGGTLAALCMTKGAGAFKAGIAVAPVTHWRFYDSIYTERYMGQPDENNAGYEKSAVLTYTGKLEGKFLLIHGTADDNVHVQHSIALSKSLVSQQKQFDMMLYPDQAHSISKSKARLHVYEKMTEFIINNL